jgi:acyl carrier protein
MAQEKFSREEIEKMLREYLAQEQAIDPARIKLESSFITDLNFDSLDGVELLIDLDDKFGIAITDEDAEKIHTVGEAIDHVYALVNTKKVEE